jgi:hypothetical protein
MLASRQYASYCLVLGHGPQLWINVWHLISLTKQRPVYVLVYVPLSANPPYRGWILRVVEISFASALTEIDGESGGREILVRPLNTYEQIIVVLVLYDFLQFLTGGMSAI